MVWERPYIFVDFLTVWDSIDKSSTEHSHMHICAQIDMYEIAKVCSGLACPCGQRRRCVFCFFFPETHTAFLFNSHSDRLKLSRANLCTHSRGCLSGMWDSAELALKEA
ncbi:hypothetical protein GOODEAATRI_008895 [Goodea atripinnis]|uniref:Uncharacterized protein n=1 Tax=Goodea atripinnis TaxID=208336 RepID=A0ABV0NT18_9TELE